MAVHENCQLANYTSFGGCQYCEEWGLGWVRPQVNMFEQVSNDGLQIPWLERGTIPCDRSHDACDVPTPMRTEWLTDAYENITFPNFVSLR